MHFARDCATAHLSLSDTAFDQLSVTAPEGGMRDGGTSGILGAL